LHNASTVYQEAIQSKFLSSSEKDLDGLLKIGEVGTTACWEASIFDDYDSDSDDNVEPFMGDNQGLVITSTPQGRFVHWKGMKLSEDDAHLVVHRNILPFQEGRSLSAIAEENLLVDYTAPMSTPHTVTSTWRRWRKESNHDPNELLGQISRDELTIDASNENDERDAHRLRYQKRTSCRARRNLIAEFVAAEERGFQTPIANIAGVTAILAASQEPHVQQGLQLAQKAWLHLDRQNPAPSMPANEEQMGESRSQ
jgi:hypothetical protein